MAKQKYYVVWAGKQAGIYTNWNDCQQQVNGFTDAKYKAFASHEEAEQAYAQGWKAHWGKGSSSSKTSSRSTGNGAAATSSSSKGGAKYNGSAKSKGKPATAAQSASMKEDAEIDYYTISVDVGTAGNPGPIEYKGVDTATGEIVFSMGPIPNGTNNLGEYLAIVHALAHIAKTGDTRNIYSDSMTAMKWVKQKAPNTSLPRNASTSEIWKLVDRATDWLNNNTYTTKIMKWQTDRWGEIKADYGRK